MYRFFLHRSFHLDQPFIQTTSSSSNDTNWGAFVETTKHPTPPTNTMSMSANTFAHPPAEPVCYFSFFIRFIHMCDL